MAKQISPAYPLLPFFGRQTEIDAIVRMLRTDDCRLLSLIGPGGMGKTRLAREVMDLLEGDFAGGCFWVDLQPVSSPEFVLPVIADVLKLSKTPNQDLFEDLTHFLAEKQVLLVLDNFETVLDFADLLSHLLNHCAQLSILLTTREALNLREEWIYRVGGLNYPESDQVVNPLQYDAVRLFVDAAQRVNPRLDFERELADILRICRHVEGMPLALEIAASWMRSLHCAQIADEIQRGLDLMTTRVRNLPERHRSMQVLFEQTTAMLSPEDFAVFKRLSVFRGSISYEAAADIAGATLVSLSVLMDKSLLQWSEDERYRMHELVRQYAGTQLAQDTQAVQAVHRGHYHYYLKLLLRWQKDLFGGDQKAAIQTLSSDLENIRLAWDTAIRFEDVDIIQQAAAAFFQFCQMTSRYDDAINLFSRAGFILEDDSLDDVMATARLILLVYLAAGSSVIGQFNRAQQYIEAFQPLLHYREGLPALVLDPKIIMFQLSMMFGQYEQAYALGQAALELGLSRNNFYAVQWAAYALSGVVLLRGDLDEAKRYAQQASEIALQRHDHWHASMCYIALGHVEHARADLETARRHFEASYQFAKDFGHLDGEVIALSYLARIAADQARFQDALALYAESISLYRRLNRPTGLSDTLESAARAAYATGNAPLATAYLYEALALAAGVHELPRVLSLMLYIAEMLLLKADPDEAHDLVQIVLSHPKSSDDLRARAHSLIVAQGWQPATDDDPFDAHMLEARVSRLLLMLLPRDEDPALSATRSSAGQDLFEPLSEREQEVLHYLARGMKNREIAEHLVISLGTIKTHVNNIFGKLGVRNRVEAVQRARELDLLQP